MKVLSKDTFYYKEPATKEDKKLIGDRKHKIRIWHWCDNYKKGRHGRIRSELAIASVENEVATYRCRHCDFVYSLDLNLDLSDVDDLAKTIDILKKLGRHAEAEAVANTLREHRK